MVKRFPICLTLLLLMLGSLILFQIADAAPRNGTVRVSGDNSWVVFVNGEEVASHSNWQEPTVSDFTLDSGYALIAIYVHDAEPGATGKGGFLADIILDDKPDYIGTGEDGWRCQAGAPIADRNDGWEKMNFDDSDWEDELQVYDKFGAGIWEFGAATMRNVLNDPDCEANWVWCGANDGEDDVYFRYTIGQLPVEPKGKVTTSWARIKNSKL